MMSVPPLSLRIRVLGPLEVEGIPGTALGSKKQRSLLRILALGRGEPVTVDRIVDRLWPENEPASPASQVMVLVSRLRTVLGADRLPRTDAGYALKADWIDLVALEALAIEAERRLNEGQSVLAATAAKAGLALARGALLVDEPDTSWIDFDRAMVERTVFRLRLIEAESALTTGDPFHAAATAEAALRDDPYDEHALRLLMTAHARAGRPGLALAAFSRARDLLKEDLEIEPDEATEALRTAIANHQMSSADQGHDDRLVAPETQLDLAVPPGRLDAWRVLDQAYASAAGRSEVNGGDEGRIQTVIVQGDAGIGKTHLVRTWTGARNAVVLWGTCDPLGAALPLEPLLDAVHRHLSKLGDDEADALREMAGPILGPLIGARSSGVPEFDPLSAPGILFVGMLELCFRAAGPASLPPILVIDDVHIADTSTLAWLRFAARRPADGSLLIIVCRRPEGPDVMSSVGLDLNLHLSVAELGPLDLEATTEIVGARQALHCTVAVAATHSSCSSSAKPIAQASKRTFPKPSSMQ